MHKRMGFIRRKVHHTATKCPFKICEIAVYKLATKRPRRFKL
jgi:hypothetical protein